MTKNLERELVPDIAVKVSVGCQKQGKGTEMLYKFGSEINRI